MKRRESVIRLGVGLILIPIVLACGISIDMGDEEKSAPEMTLEAIYSEQTLAVSGEESAADGETTEDPYAGVSHEMVPGNPGSPDVEKEEIDSKNTAGTKTALGDSFRLGNFERPFTEGDMIYHPELDMVYLRASKGSDFYYFTIELSTAGDEGYPSGFYGVEIDTDFDGRGDYLLWAKGTDSTDWTIADVMLLEDLNGDVGGSSPVVPDNKTGNGYERVLFSADVLDDPDIAWVRLDPSSGSIIQLAVKISNIDTNRWYWRGWADAGVADPAQFDYNDQFSEEQAGSPNKSGGFYPIGALNMMDSTCWIAFNLTPTGTEVGGCVKVQPPPPAEAPGCVCVPGCYGTELSCCNQCPGCVLSQTNEFCSPFVP